jgi:branched-chain amino acid transport system ATP-binding protein
MLAIARGLISRPDLLMLDEPSLGLSPTRVDQVFDLIAELKARGMTILLVEQNVTRALSLADRTYLFSNGHVEYAGRPSDMTRDINVEAVYLGGYEGGSES